MTIFSDLTSEGDIIESWMNKMNTSKGSDEPIGVCTFIYFCTEYACGCEQSCKVTIDVLTDEYPRSHEWFPCMKTAQLPSADTPYFRKFVLCVDPDGVPLRW